MKLHKFLIILTTLVAVMLTLVVWFFPANEDFRNENPFWNGAKDISLAIQASPVKSFADLPKRSTLILVPYLGFNTGELEQLNSFVNQGGTLVLADDYGYGNQVLEYMGLDERFSGQALLDPVFNYKNSQFPRIYRLNSDPLTSDVQSLVFNHATSLLNVNDEEALALSSSFSFLDLNNNGAPDKEEPAGPLSVFSRHKLGSGQLILIADPSIIINSTEKIEGNLNFIQNLAWTSPAIFIDQSHLPPSNLQESKSLLATLRSYCISPTGTMSLLAVALALALMPLWKEKKGEAVD